MASDREVNNPFLVSLSEDSLVKQNGSESNLNGSFNSSFGSTQFPDLSFLDAPEKHNHDRIMHMGSCNSACLTKDRVFDSESPSQGSSCSRNANRQYPSVVWKGDLCFDSEHPPRYSPKIFISRLPPYITKQDLRDLFLSLGYGEVVIDRPNKASRPFTGILNYCYAQFGNGNMAAHFLFNHCRRSTDTAPLVLPLGAPWNTDCEVVPFNINDAAFASYEQMKDEESLMVFVGGIHGRVTAACLYNCFNTLFKGVQTVALMLDKRTEYPMGTARISFNNPISFRRAIKAEFVTMHVVGPTGFQKNVQVDPFLESSICLHCDLKLNRDSGLFCRSCCNYACHACCLTTHEKHNIVSRKGPVYLTNPAPKEIGQNCDEPAATRRMTYSGEKLEKPASESKNWSSVYVDAWKTEVSEVSGSNPDWCGDTLKPREIRVCHPATFRESTGWRSYNGGNQDEINVRISNPPLGMSSVGGMKKMANPGLSPVSILDQIYPQGH